MTLALFLIIASQDAGDGKLNFRDGVRSVFGPADIDLAVGHDDVESAVAHPAAQRLVARTYRRFVAVMKDRGDGCRWQFRDRGAAHAAAHDPEHLAVDDMGAAAAVVPDRAGYEPGLAGNLPAEVREQRISLDVRVHPPAPRRDERSRHALDR